MYSVLGIYVHASQQQHWHSQTIYFTYFHSIKAHGTIFAGNAPYSTHTFTLEKKMFYTEVVQYLQIHALVIWIHISITQLHCKQPRKFSRDPFAFIYTYLYKDKLHKGNMKRELHCTSE